MSRQDEQRRTPTADEKEAMRGTKGRPSRRNRFVTETDPRLAAGTTHASSHEAGGDDAVEFFAVHTSDPVAASPQPSPPVDSVWFVRGGTSPETVSLRACIDGVIGTLQTWNAP